MPKKTLEQYLHDIIIAINALISHTENFTLQDYFLLSNKWFVERGISIVGEALYKANNLDRNLPITNIKQIISTRHIVVHDYDIVDETRLMIIVQKHLPILKTEVELILKNITSSTPLK